MKQKDLKQKQKGAEGFDCYYREVYGNRWGELKNALSAEQVYCTFAQENKEPYFLDPASVCVALSLEISQSSQILDMCAAPGGKTLILSSVMNAEASLSSNERSAQRKKRLDNVVSGCLPESISSRIVTSCSDAALWCRNKTECFDSILLDAPCSSERHVLNDEKYLAEWTPSRVKSISIEQWSLLSCAFRLLKKGGWLLYSTCALAPKENEENVKKLIKKFDNALPLPFEEMKKVFETNKERLGSVVKCPDGISLEEIFSLAEPLEYGFHILPDKTKGCGPLFFCLIKSN